MADYQGVLADLKNRRIQIDRERAELDITIASLERLARANTPSVRQVSQKPAGPEEARAAHYPFSTRQFATMTMPQAVMAFFEYMGEPQTARQIREGVIAGGARTSPNARGHVYNTLSRLSENGGPVVHLQDGRWSLRGWPVARNGSQQRLLASSEE